MKGLIIIIEIERKFLIDKFPQELPMIFKADVEQGYLSTDPTVRIRMCKNENEEKYELCFKSKGSLVRQEVELEITKEVYQQLKNMLKAPIIVKDFRIFELSSGQELECSLVDPGSETAFYYAEVEFDSVEQANAFIPPDWIGWEVTEQPEYAMAEYWNRKLKRLNTD